MSKNWDYKALYHDPKVLVLDEATNSLDSYTEKLVLDAINSLSQKLTIIIITHRLNTLKVCDKVVLLEKGKIIADDKYDKLVENHKFFKLISSNLIKDKS